jgi:hypothetical protein
VKTRYSWQRKMMIDGVEAGKDARKDRVSKYCLRHVKMCSNHCYKLDFKRKLSLLTQCASNVATAVFLFASV